MLVVVFHGIIWPHDILIFSLNYVRSVCRRDSSSSFIFITNTISDNLCCAAVSALSTWYSCAGLQLVIPALLWLTLRALALSQLMYLWFQERLSGWSLMAGSRVHVFMSVHSDARLDSFGYKIRASEPCMEIVSQLQRIFSYPTGQGAALQTNLPPSISLCDWQPGIWLETKSVNSIRVCETHILHMEKLWIRAAPQSLTRHFTRCTSPCSSFLIRHGLKWSRKGWIECRSDALLTSALQSEMLPRKTGCRVTDWRGDRKSESYSVSIKSRILKTFDGLRLLCLRNNPSSCNGVLRWHATVLISPPMNICNCSAALP